MHHGPASVALVLAFAHAFAAWSDYVARVQRCNRHDLHNIRSAVLARAGLPPITFGRRMARNGPALLALHNHLALTLRGIHSMLGRREEAILDADPASAARVSDLDNG